MQREQERERRRLRDRQRRQSMTQEQRERHLARRRRNYQLRRQRAANAPFIPLPQPLESTTREASTSHHEPQWITSSTSSLHHTVLYHGLHQGQETLNLGTQVVEVQPMGSSIQLEAQADKPTNLQRKRLNHIKRLARNLIRPNPICDPNGNHQVAVELMVKGDVSSGEGSTVKPLRLNRVKRLARSMSTPSKEISARKIHEGTVEEEQNVTQSSIQSLGNESCIASI